MYIPVGGFGYVTAERATAEPGTVECPLSISVASTDMVDDLIRIAGEAGAEIAKHPEHLEWGYSGTIADPDGRLWEVLHPAGRHDLVRPGSAVRNRTRRGRAASLEDTRTASSPQGATGGRAALVVILQSGGDIVWVISEVVVMEQILIRNLPAGTKAALRARASRRHRSVEAEARDVLTTALEGEPVTILDLLGTDDGADIEFEPERLGLTARSAQL